MQAGAATWWSWRTALPRCSARRWRPQKRERSSSWALTCSPPLTTTPACMSGAGSLPLLLQVTHVRSTALHQMPRL